MPDTRSSPAAPRTTVPRRALLGAGIGVGLGGVLGLGAGCSVASPDGSPGVARSAPAGSDGSDGAGTDGGSSDADEQLVADVLDDLARTRALVVGVRRRHDDLAAPLGGLARLHRAHGRELGGLRSATGSGPRPARRAAVALRQVTTAEQDLQVRLVSASVDSRSGVLAGLLASMAAAVAQELTLLAVAGEQA